MTSGRNYEEELEQAVNEEMARYTGHYDGYRETAWRYHSTKLLLHAMERIAALEEQVAELTAMKP